MNESIRQSAFTSRIAYRDLRAAVEFLEKAFGFKVTMLATVSDGKVVHAEMKFGDGVIQIGSEWENIKAPISAGGVNTQNITVRLEIGIEEHCERARAAGGKIIQEPQDQFHGDRTYRAADPEGHVWTFSQKLREMTVAELEAGVPGMKVWKT